MKKKEKKINLKPKKIKKKIYQKEINDKKVSFISIKSHIELTQNSFLYRLLCGSFIENLKEYLLKGELKIKSITSETNDPDTSSLEKTLIWYFVAFIRNKIKLHKGWESKKIEKTFFELYTFENEDENLKLKKIFLFLCTLKKNCDLFNLVAQTITCEERKNEFTRIIENIKYENWSEKTWIDDFRKIYIALFLNVIH